MLTPVEEYDGIYYKRDDLFCPWGDVNGGKVRQAIELFATDEIQSSSGVIASVSVHSPTGPVISRVAEKYGKHCTIAIGGTTEERLDKLPMMKLTKHFGADVKIVAGHGMKTAINARVNEICKDSGYHNIDYSKVSNFYLDDIYEAKAHKWMLENIDLNQKILFWCVGRRLTNDEVESICTR